MASSLRTTLKQRNDVDKLASLSVAEIDKALFETDRLVQISYRLSDGQGNEIDASASDEPSPGLRCLGRDDQLAQSSLRISLGRASDAEQVDRAAAEIRRGIMRLRAIARPPQRAHV